MTSRSSAHCDTIYGFSCTSTTTSATETLLSVSYTHLQTTTREKTLETFMEVMEGNKAETSDKGCQRKVKATGNAGTSGEDGCSYVFDHFDDLEKYMQRYRYYHTVCDTGQARMNLQELGIEIANGSSDGSSNRSSRSVVSVEPSTDEFRTLVLRSRRSVSDMSMSSIRRQKSAPCCRNPKSSKRVYLTWEQYVELCGNDIPTHQRQFSLEAGGALVSGDVDETTTGTVSRRKVTSAYSTKRTPGLDLRPLSSRTKCTGNVNLNEKEREGVNEKSVSKPCVGTSSTTPPTFPGAKSEVCLSEYERKLPQRMPAKLDNVSKLKSCKLTAKKDQIKGGSSITEGSLQSRDKSRKKITSLPESHLEQSLSSMKISDKQSAGDEKLKKVVSIRCRNSRVSAVYKFTKLRRKQIHL